MARTVLKKGDLICYRMGLVKVLKVDQEGAWVRGDGGLEQGIDWEDIEQYNRGEYKCRKQRQKKDSTATAS